MGRTTKQDGSGRTLIFSGLRWPTAQPFPLPKADRLRAALYKATRGRLMPLCAPSICRSSPCSGVRGASGRPSPSMPAGVVSRTSTFTTRRIAPRSCSAVATRSLDQGDPRFRSTLPNGPSSNEHCSAASLLWGEPNENGISYPLDRPTGARSFFDDPYAMSMVQKPHRRAASERRRSRL